MYGRRAVTKEDILKRVSSKDIFKYIFQEEIEVDIKKYKSPFRQDSTGNCYFVEYNEDIHFVDFSVSKIPFDCFSTYKLKYKLKSFQQVLVEINKNLVGIGSENPLPIIYEYKEKKVAVKKEKIPIRFSKRNFTKKDLEFWSKYGITKQQLQEDNVFSVSCYQIYSHRKNQYFTFNISDYKLCFAIVVNESVKIYRPEEDKELKWFTDCSEDDVGNYENLPKKGDTLVITKSYKDFRVIKNQNYNNCIWFQNEGMFPNLYILLSLAKRFTNIYILFDNDTTGISESYNLKQIISTYNKNVKSIFIPPILKNKGIKDSSDLYYIKGKILLEKFLTKNINNNEI